MTKNPAQPVPTKLLPIVISSEFANFAVDMEKGDKLDKKFTAWQEKMSAQREERKAQREEEKREEKSRKRREKDPWEV